jgi:hypothetical protein
VTVTRGSRGQDNEDKHGLNMLLSCIFIDILGKLSPAKERAFGIIPQLAQLSTQIKWLQGRMPSSIFYDIFHIIVPTCTSKFAQLIRWSFGGNENLN